MNEIVNGLDGTETQLIVITDSDSVQDEQRNVLTIESVSTANGYKVVLTPDRQLTYREEKSLLTEVADVCKEELNGELYSNRIAESEDDTVVIEGDIR